MSKTSAGILLYRQAAEGLEVLIVHPGGPLFARKDAGAWSIPKGETVEGENLIETARREFQEELGFQTHGEMLPLGNVRLKSGKIVHAWAIDGSNSSFDLTKIKSNTFRLEWPPHPGKFAEFPDGESNEAIHLKNSRQSTRHQGLCRSIALSNCQGGGSVGNLTAARTKNATANGGAGISST